MRLFFSFFVMMLLVSCATKGELEYITSNGEHKTACETEYTWEPSVDKYAVEYILSYCARKAVKKGHKVVDESLLNIDLSISLSPNGNSWTFDYAKELHSNKKLSDKEYGYIIAYIDLGLNKD
ncbi:hypothetical protein RI844_13650 [Thalassotalea fonticola]|uniref:Lipoprotein n=1 Tax=Thalassotalea fonticola TaxID=3065649 RepID=A0ABZ0GLI0_9GAMM|nr:hypothetical protein RI844_13650 [Colwelliaceae bacterium S1-1]